MCQSAFTVNYDNLNCHLVLTHTVKAAGGIKQKFQHGARSLFVNQVARAGHHGEMGVGYSREELLGLLDGHGAIISSGNQFEGCSKAR